MSEVRFSEDFKTLISKTFGIRPSQVLEVLASPDQTDVLTFHGSDIKVHTKLLPATDPPCTLLVIEGIEGNDRTVSTALKAYPQLSRNLQQLRPMEVLRALTDSFGLLIRVGCQTGKLIVSESFEVPSEGGYNLLQGLESPSGSMISGTYFKLEPGPPPMAYCALAFGLDTDLYSSWVTSVVRSSH
jgi:hypothetical protein